MDQTAPHRTVAVTGATGFIAQGVLPALTGAGLAVRAISRQATLGGMDGVTWHQVGAYDDVQALAGALDGVDTVVHLADNPDRAEARSAEQGAAIARALVQAMGQAGGEMGAGRLVVTSSVYARLAPEPGSYGHAKAQLEAALAGAVAGADGPRQIILRLPPVYGPGGGGGFATLAKLAAKGLPLPFGLARAPRGYLSRDNLAGLITTLVQAGDAAWDRARAEGPVFEPSDGTPISTAELTRALARAQGKTARLLPVPLGVLRLLGRVTGKADMIAGAIDGLTPAGNAPLEQIFGWTPAQSMPESLKFLKPVTV